MQKVGNRNVRPIVLWVVLMACCLVLTGCIKADYHLKVNGDGSLDVDFKVLLDRTMLRLLGDNDPLADLRDNAEKQGYQVENYTEGEFEGLRLRKHVDHPDQLKLTGLDDRLFKLPEDFKIKREKRFWTETVSVDETLDLRDVDLPFGATALKLFGNRADLTFTLSLPLRPDSHNATDVSENGKTLSWKIQLGEQNRLQLKLTAPHIKNILIVGAVVLLLLIALVVYLVYRWRAMRKRSISTS